MDPDTRVYATEEQRRMEQYEDVALEWIERLADPVDESTLAEAASHLLPRHYDDLLQERDAEHRCGYPVCPNAPKIISSKYRIRNGKFYDQEPLKPYCSPRCYKASAVYRSQLSSEPLFMRGNKDPLQIKLLPLIQVGTDDTLVEVEVTRSSPVIPASPVAWDMSAMGKALEHDGELVVVEKEVEPASVEAPDEGDWEHIEGIVPRSMSAIEER